MIKLIGALFLMITTSTAFSEDYSLPNFSFNSIDGGVINLNDFKGKVILITNTASKCGFTGQYNGLQALYENYKNRGLVVFGIPSTDFRQEYNNSDTIKNFCEINFGISFPMSEVTKVLGKNAHPFYSWLSEKHNFIPRWNFNKVLIDKKGKIVNTYGAMVRPNSDKMNKTIAELLIK